MQYQCKQEGTRRRAGTRKAQLNQAKRYGEGRGYTPQQGLANRRLQPLGHSSVVADMPDTGASRKLQIAGGRNLR